jgi:hypothetical protein
LECCLDKLTRRLKGLETSSLVVMISWKRAEVAASRRSGRACENVIGNDRISLGELGVKAMKQTGYM